jgi:hypothetical protein
MWECRRPPSEVRVPQRLQLPVLQQVAASSAALSSRPAPSNSKVRASAARRHRLKNGQWSVRSPVSASPPKSNQAERNKRFQQQTTIFCKFQGPGCWARPAKLTCADLARISSPTRLGCPAFRAVPGYLAVQARRCSRAGRPLRGISTGRRGAGRRIALC